MTSGEETVHWTFRGPAFIGPEGFRVEWPKVSAYVHTGARIVDAKHDCLGGKSRPEWYATRVVDGGFEVLQATCSVPARWSIGTDLSGAEFTAELTFERVDAPAPAESTPSPRDDGCGDGLHGEDVSDTTRETTKAATMNSNEQWVDCKVAELKEGETVRFRSDRGRWSGPVAFPDLQTARAEGWFWPEISVQRLVTTPPAEEWVTVSDGAELRVGDLARFADMTGFHIGDDRINTEVELETVRRSHLLRTVAYHAATRRKLDADDMKRTDTYANVHAPTSTQWAAESKPITREACDEFAHGKAPDDPDAGPGGEWEGVPAEMASLTTSQTGDRFWRDDSGPWVDISEFAAKMHATDGGGYARWIKRASHPRHIANVAARSGAMTATHIAGSEYVDLPDPVTYGSDTQVVQCFYGQTIIRGAACGDVCIVAGMTLHFVRQGGAWYRRGDEPPAAPAPKPIAPDPLAVLRTEAARMMADGADPRDVLGALDCYAMVVKDDGPPHVSEFRAMVGMYRKDRLAGGARVEQGHCAHNRLATQHCGHCAMVLRRPDAQASVSDGAVWSSAGDES